MSHDNHLLMSHDTKWSLKAATAYTSAAVIACIMCRRDQVSTDLSSRMYPHTRTYTSDRLACADPDQARINRVR